MAWFDKQMRSRREVDLERKALAASVEEMAARNEPVEDLWNTDKYASTPQKAALVPPRLSLQSRPLPVVRVETLNQARVAREQTQPVSGSQAAPIQSRRLGRSTKVHLQAVRPDEEKESVTDRVAVVPERQEESAQDQFAAGGRRDSQTSQPVQSEGDVSSGPRLPGGSAMFVPGQKEIMIPHSGVTERSVVMVMLAGDPGPVVVHYVSLHARRGFTVHLSAPVDMPTPFNYIVWSC